MVNQNPSTITFLGTAGARFMVSKQLAASGGIWMDLAGTQMLIDPGPGCIVQSTKRKLAAEKLSAIILTHRHLDHSNDVNIMVEAMTEGGFKKRGWFFAPSDAVDTCEPVLFKYLRSSLEGIGLLQEGKAYRVGNINFQTPLRHDHPVETYGIIFEVAGHKFAYISDTRYFDALVETYRVELLIINVVLTAPRQAIAHLSIPDVEHLVREIKPKVAILTHYGMNMWRARPWEVAEKLTQDTGIKVMAGRDGMKFDLASLDQASSSA